MDLDRILTELEEERDRLSRAIGLLKEVKAPRVGRKTAAPNPANFQAAAARSYVGRQKAALRDDEEVLGRKEKEEFLRVRLQAVDPPGGTPPVGATLSASRRTYGQAIEKLGKPHAS